MLIFVITASLFSCSNPTADFEPIVQMVRDGSLKPDKNGVIILPDEFEKNLAGTKIYFEQKSDGLILILFATSFGRGEDMDGYLYCNRELQPSDFYTIDWGSGNVQQHIDVAAKDLLSVELLKPNWYQASRRLE